MGDSYTDSHSTEGFMRTRRPGLGYVEAENSLAYAWGEVDTSMTPTVEHVKLWFADPAKARQFFGNFKIQENGCQLWLGPFFESGHGRYRFDGSDVRVHRLRWVRRRGRCPELR